MKVKDKAKSAIRDHHGKTSQARVAALVSTLTGCAIAAGPLWGAPEPSMELVLVLLGGPSGLALWQKLSVPQEQPEARRADEQT